MAQMWTTFGEWNRVPATVLPLEFAASRPEKVRLKCPVPDQHERAEQGFGVLALDV